jgi:hypothetical protein
MPGSSQQQNGAMQIAPFFCRPVSADGAKKKAGLATGLFRFNVGLISRPGR